MALSPQEMRSILSSSGVPSVPGLDLPAVFAATAASESGGDSRAVGEAGEVGVLQIHPSNRSVWEATSRVLTQPLADAESFRRQATAAAGLMRDALQRALEAADTLRERGFPVGTEDLAALIDSAWQHSSEFLRRWAETTKSGLMEEVNPRLDRFRGWLDKIERRAAAVGEGAAVLLLAFVVLGLWAWSRR